MKENREEILAELERELLEEAEAETLEESLDTENTEALLTEPVRGDEMVYRNYSNNYGADLRNFANGYQARNTDSVDVDLDAFSRKVAEGEEDPFPWVPLGIMIAAAAAVVYMLLTVLGGIL